VTSGKYAVHIGKLDFLRHNVRHMSKHISETPATQFLRRHGVVFSEHPYHMKNTAARQYRRANWGCLSTMVIKDAGDAG